MLKKILFVILAVVLLVSPLVIRRFYFYEGQYEPGEVPRPDLALIEEQVLQTRAFADEPSTETLGTVLVDLAHGNYVRMSELNVLQARLAARGRRLEPLVEAGDLAGKLRYVEALVIISPGTDWTPSEARQVQEFVDKGGRLLLIADPTRYTVSFDEWGDFSGLDYSPPHINDLAARFGIVFQSDYLYNTVENEGNFRNIRLTDLAEGKLTRDVEQLVFYAAHSIVSQEPALISTGGETRSSASERPGDLAVGVLTADGAVLALGDLTFMTEPYNAVRDNDRFVANLADFLSGTERAYDLADFPFFFDDQVDLVYTGGPLLDSSLLAGGSSLQALFARQGKTLTLRAEEDEATDTLFMGLYDQAEEAEPYLEAAGVTLLITPTQTVEEEETETEPLTDTVLIIPSTSVTPTEEITPTESVMPAEGIELLAETEEGAEAEPEAPAPSADRISIEPLGEMVLTGTSLLLWQIDGDRNAMVVLAHTEKDLEKTVERLTDTGLGDCVFHEATTAPFSTIALCPTGEAAKDGGWQESAPEEPEAEEPPDAEETPDAGETPPEEPPLEETPEPPAEPAGSVLVVSLDAGEGRYDSMTGAADYARILQAGYDVTTWSVATDGPLDEFVVFDYDLVIWASGDFEEGMGDEYSDLVFGLMLEGIPIVLSGAYIGDTATEAVQVDIQVHDATHPLAQGFESGQVIDLVPSPSGAEYETGVLEDFGEEGEAILFVRGPGSEESGIPSIVGLEDEFTGMRILFVGIPLYLLPEEAKSQLVLNAAAWLLSP